MDEDSPLIFLYHLKNRLQVRKREFTENELYHLVLQEFSEVFMSYSQRLQT